MDEITYAIEVHGENYLVIIMTELSLLIHLFNYTYAFQI